MSQPTGESQPGEPTERLQAIELPVGIRVELDVLHELLRGEGELWRLRDAIVATVRRMNEAGEYAGHLAGEVASLRQQNAELRAALGAPETPPPHAKAAHDVMIHVTLSRYVDLVVGRGVTSREERQAKLDAIHAAIDAFAARAPSSPPPQPKAGLDAPGCICTYTDKGGPVYWPNCPIHGEPASSSPPPPLSPQERERMLSKMGFIGAAYSSPPPPATPSDPEGADNPAQFYDPPQRLEEES